MEIQELLKPRYKVIADYPDSIFKIGGILVQGEKDLTEIAKYPHLFSKLEWWEHRTIEELESVKFVKVVIYRGYWVVGDIVKVVRFERGTTDPKSPKPTGYYIGRHNGMYQPIFELEPATETEYLTYLNSKK